MQSTPAPATKLTGAQTSPAINSSYFMPFSPPLRTLRWNVQTKQLANVILQTNSSRRLLVHANASSSRGKGSSTSDVVMVDPIEAKRLAAKQMQEIRAKEKFKRRSQAEAINGTLAMIGLTAALVAEGQTGKGIFGQLTGYWDAIISLV